MSILTTLAFLTAPGLNNLAGFCTSLKLLDRFNWKILPCRVPVTATHNTFCTYCENKTILNEF